MTERPTVFCDLDGVIWLAHEPIAGSVEAVSRLRQSGHRVIFVTNNSFATIGEQIEALGAIGIPAAGDVLTSAMACARLIKPDDRVLVCGGPGIVEAVRSQGGLVLDHDRVDRRLDEVDVVIVGFHRHFDYEIMRRAAQAVRSGAVFLATNDDATYPTPDGEIPGGGSILAAIETAAGCRAEVAGKPHRAMATALREIAHLSGSVRGGPVDLSSPGIMVGDRPSTDGEFARTLGSQFALVRSGVTAPHWTVESHPEHFGSCPITFDFADLRALADFLTAS